MDSIPSALLYQLLVSRGDITLEVAAEMLSIETSGGLTPVGAADVISDPIRAQATLDFIADSARAGLDRIRRMRKERSREHGLGITGSHAERSETSTSAQEEANDQTEDLFRKAILAIKADLGLEVRDDKKEISFPQPWKYFRREKYENLYHLSIC
jgi:hypothetical protein